jgi:hypothetical protein
MNAISTSKALIHVLYLPSIKVILKIRQIQIKTAGLSNTFLCRALCKCQEWLSYLCCVVIHRLDELFPRNFATIVHIKGEEVLSEHLLTVRTGEAAAE